MERRGKKSLTEIPLNKMIIVILQTIFIKDGTVAEWLGGGLQNLRQRFESARYLISFLYENTNPLIINIIIDGFFVLGQEADEIGDMY